MRRRPTRVAVVVVVGAPGRPRLLADMSASAAASSAAAAATTTRSLAWGFFVLLCFLCWCCWARILFFFFCFLYAVTCAGNSSFCFSLVYHIVAFYLFGLSLALILQFWCSFSFWRCMVGNPTRIWSWITITDYFFRLSRQWNLLLFKFEQSSFFWLLSKV